jgi:eukaryotic-like serine/threonine-protein kinase
MARFPHLAALGRKVVSKMPHITENPYNYHAPIQDPRSFVGRSADLQLAREYIESKQSISFVGEPHCGLSSLLNHLTTQDFYVQCDISLCKLYFVHIDCSLFTDPLPLLTHLFAQLAPDRPMRTFTNWRTAFGRLIPVVESLPKTRVVLLLDDFEPMGASSLFVEFIDALRGLALRTDMTLITATHTELHKACHKDVVASPFCNIFRVRYVGAFSAEEASTLIQSMSALSGVDLSPYTDNITRLGGRFPYFLQMACSHYYEAITQGKELDHQAIAQRFTQEVLPEFQHIWQRLDTNEKNALFTLAKGQESLGDGYARLERKGYLADQRILSETFRDFVRNVADKMLIVS